MLRLSRAPIGMGSSQGQSAAVAVVACASAAVAARALSLYGGRAAVRRTLYKGKEHAQQTSQERNAHALDAQTQQEQYQARTSKPKQEQQRQQQPKQPEQQPQQQQQQPRPFAPSSSYQERLSSGLRRRQAGAEAEQFGRNKTSFMTGVHGLATPSSLPQRKHPLYRMFNEEDQKEEAEREAIERDAKARAAKHQFVLPRQRQFVPYQPINRNAEDVAAAKPHVFASNYVMDDYARTMIVRLYKSDPRTWTLRALSQRFNISRNRVQAILQLAALTPKPFTASLDTEPWIPHDLDHFRADSAWIPGDMLLNTPAFLKAVAINALRDMRELGHSIGDIPALHKAVESGNTERVQSRFDRDDRFATDLLVELYEKHASTLPPLREVAPRLNDHITPPKLDFTTTSDLPTSSAVLLRVSDPAAISFTNFWPSSTLGNAADSSEWEDIHSFEDSDSPDEVAEATSNVDPESAEADLESEEACLESEEDVEAEHELLGSRPVVANMDAEQLTEIEEMEEDDMHFMVQLERNMRDVRLAHARRYGNTLEPHSFAPLNDTSTLPPGADGRNIDYVSYPSFVLADDASFVQTVRAASNPRPISFAEDHDFANPLNLQSQTLATRALGAHRHPITFVNTSKRQDKRRREWRQYNPETEAYVPDFRARKRITIAERDGSLRTATGNEAVVAQHLVYPAFRRTLRSVLPANLPHPDDLPVA
ncbi:hypothetical protein CAOG_00944 [Capsaspora owczarzaki ATCC 30864]|uniref:Uncharacterized protein n=1 Tax=Capsaspora owczarzaki (strain ATCC 30864) TaxID=595528 RepID=A0A0D2VHR2_CAPO3|nr:hypothetical protein CAOG_00944 [Capsaspora owczarzaki ATCC 30864]KJE89482.1 hypothetical protein CAOG_000944 [Capsaspora owczarzaki ATCC 30864]|eukprot:XP_004365815.2 hypothetical protein CAOG_00944 [Capsaspora owczarzaki ATCC 30864]